MTTLTMNSAEELETISRLSFKTCDVLFTQGEKVRRRANLLKAVVLDSLHQSEVVLTLEDDNTTRKLKARIIATGDERVMLDKGISIPVQCILQVEFP
jgi:hypothetical protein